MMIGTRPRVFGGAAAYTLDPGRPRAEALAVANGLIVAVGPVAECRAAAGPDAELVDLGGGCVVPGLVDCHIHLLACGLRLRQVDVSGARSPQEAAALVAAARGRFGAAEWIVGGGWDKSAWGGEFPRKEALDAAVGGRPACLFSKDIHTLWANSAALAAAGIDAATPDPPGGTILRDAGGSPAGALLERAAEMIWRVVPRPPLEARVDALQNAIARLHSVGVTGVHNCEGPDALSALEALEAAGGLRLRVVAHIAAATLDSALALGVRTGLGGDGLRIGGVKVFADGALGSQTAWCLEPYGGAGDGRGVVVTPAGEMARLAARAAAGGLAVTIHAIGDAAVRAALDAIAAARRAEEAAAPAAARGAALPHRVEHVQLLHPEDLPRFSELGAIASMQPIHATSDRDLADRFWGRRCRLAYPWRALLSAGARLCFGSDAPVEDPDPRRGLYAALTRKRPADREPWYPEQRLGWDEALAAYTVAAAHAAGTAGRLGRLGRGMAADFTAFSRDIGSLGPEAAAALLETRVTMTVVGGEVVFAG